jgi:hypothetical protein
MTTATPSSPSVAGVKDDVQAAAVRAKPWVAKLVRLGYAAKGFVYCVVGVLAFQAAFGSAGEGETTGSRGAMDAILRQPFGRILLGTVAVGLAGYALWQFFRTAFDPEHDSNDHGPKSLGRRAMYLLSAVIHTALVVAAVKTLMGTAGAHDDNAQAQGWTATFMSYPYGRWLVGLGGLGIAIYGLMQVRKGYRSDLDKQLALGSMSSTAHRLAILAGRFGIAARGIVFVVIGALLVMAAYHEDSDEARGLGGALDTLQQQAYGPWLLGAVALGLIAYGLYLFIRARYRRIDLM